MQFQFRDVDTGVLLDFTGAFIAISVEDCEGRQRILATTANGKISILASGIIELAVDKSEMGLCSGTYPIGGVFQLNGETNDLFEGSLSIRRGIPKL